MNHDEYIIVKRLSLDSMDNPTCNKDFPKLPKLPLEENASTTYSGQKVGIQVSYNILDDALADLKRMNEFNPSGYYGLAIVDNSVISN